MVTNLDIQEENDHKWVFSIDGSEKVNFGCTSLKINDSNGDIYHGRTLEYASDLPFNITYYPLGYDFNYLAPDNQTKGMSYKTKYEILALTFPASEFFNPQVEGVNSAGLSASLNMKPCSELPDLQANQYPTSLNWALAMEWALSTCATVQEVKDKIGDVFFWTTGSPFSVLIEFHYVFYDNTGACLVAEVNHGKIDLIDNPTGVLTNAPDLNWHLTNLNNYTHLTNKDVSTSTKLGNMKLKQPDTGIATASLPSSDTSVGRFVRAVFYSSFVMQRDTPEGAMLELSHIMNKFDRPKNITQSEISESGQASANGSSEYTEWTTLTDLKKGEILVRTYNDINYTKYAICDFVEGKKKVSIPIIK